jgi:hypothetical protein
MTVFWKGVALALNGIDAKRDPVGDGVCDELVPLLQVAVGVGKKKITEATYPSPVTDESEEKSTVRKLDVDVTESPTLVRNPSSVLSSALLAPSYTTAGSQQASASAKASVKLIKLPAGAAKVDGRQSQLLP